MISEKLRELRLKRGLSQKEIARILNVGQTTYSQYERGVCEPNIECLKKISRYYSISLDDLLETHVKPVTVDIIKLELNNLDSEQVKEVLCEIVDLIAKSIQ